MISTHNPTERRASHKTFRVVYKTTCTVTGHFYFGMHSTDDMNDGYLGSGVRLVRSVAKYGKAAHHVEIISTHETREEASLAESLIITPKLLSDPKCMNCGPGGQGAFDRPSTAEETRAKLSAASKNYVRTKAWYDKIVASRMANGGYGTSKEVHDKIRRALTGRTLSEKHRQAIRDGHLGKKRTPEARANMSKSMKGKNKGPKPPFSEDHRKAISLSRLGKKLSEEEKLLRREKALAKRQLGEIVENEY